MLDNLRVPITVVGRILLALMFILSGFDKLIHIEGDAAYMASGNLPALSAITVAVGLVALNRYWSLPADQQMVQYLLFMKHLAVAGGMFLVAALGPGPGSLGSKYLAR